MRALYFLILISFSTSIYAISDLICEIEISQGRGETLLIKFDTFEAQGHQLAYVRYDSEFFSNAMVPGCLVATVTDIGTSLVFSCANPVDGEFTGSAAQIKSDGSGRMEFFKEGPLGFEEGGMADLKNCEETNFQSSNPF